MECDIELMISADDQLQQNFTDELAKAVRLLAQEITSSNKLYSLHAPVVERIIRSKAHKCYEFEVKASIAVTNRSSFVVGGIALLGNQYDGHTLKQALIQVRALSGQHIEEVYVSRGYRGNDETERTGYISGHGAG